MLSLADEDLELEQEPIEPERTGGAASVQTPSLGSKQSVVRWLPTGSSAIAVAGSWDERMCGLTLWSVSFDAMEQDSEVDNARELCSTEHDGDVLGLAVAGGATHRMYTASGAGGVCCYVVGDLDEASPSLLRTWRAVGDESPTLGVCWAEDIASVCAVSEDGILSLFAEETGKETHHIQSAEPALYDVCWLPTPNGSGSVAATAGSRISLWDVRSGSR